MGKVAKKATEPEQPRPNNDAYGLSLRVYRILCDIYRKTDGEREMKRQSGEGAYILNHLIQ